MSASTRLIPCLRDCEQLGVQLLACGIESVDEHRRVFGRARHVYVQVGFGPSYIAAGKVSLAGGGGEMALEALKDALSVALSGNPADQN